MASWTSEAGPRQTSKVESAWTDLRAHAQSYIEVYDDMECVLLPIGRWIDLSPESRAILDAVIAKYEGKITRANHKAVLDSIAAAKTQIVLPRIDKRRNKGEG